MKTVKQLAGFTPGEANALRRALGKKKMEQVLTYKDKFLEGCAAHQISAKVAEKIWVSIEAAGRYAFNKSHAVGYAIISTWEVWVKHYFPIEFMAALLATDGENINRYVRESRRLKFRILPPDINKSDRHFTLGPVGSGEIRYGLEAVRGLAKASCTALERGRPYLDFSDYMARGGKGADKTQAYNLIRIGAFESMGTRKEMVLALERERAKEGLAPSTLGNPIKLEAAITRRITSNPEKWCLPMPDFDDPKVIYKIEQELCGNYILVDPLSPHMELIRKNCINEPSDMEGFKRGAKFCVGGMLTEIKTHSIKKKGPNFGREMAFLKVQWNELDFEVTAFADIWADSRDLLQDVGVPVIFEVKRDDRGCHLTDMIRLDIVNEY
jgi:DNA polymerase-3 subunit alpha